MSYADIFAGILVGGHGRRLGGVDKARLPRTDHDDTLLGHLLGVLGPEVAAVRLSGRPEQSYPEAEAPLVADLRPDAGPLGGLEALLAAAPTPWCFLVACDLPDFDVGILHTVAKARRSGVRAVILESAHGLEPTCSLYHRDLFSDLRTALDRGDRAVRDFIARSEHLRVRLSDDLVPALRNINGPGD
jgi:molybdenum cofactor guanylyltransferase